MTTDAQREVEKAAREYVRRQYPFYTDQAAFGAGVANGEVHAFVAGAAWQASKSISDTRRAAPPAEERSPS